MKKTLSLILLLGMLLSIAISSASAQLYTGTSEADWGVSYFDNAYLGDPPTLETEVDEIIFDWGFGSPDPSIPNDLFSARYATDTFFEAGTYRFTVLADDHVKIGIDENVILNTFNGGQTSNPITVDVDLAGTHHIQIDYRELEGVAYLNVTWQDVRTIGLPTATPQPVVENAYLVVDVPVLNVRDAPTTSGSTVIDKIEQGESYNMLARTVDSNWVLIDNAGEAGWVYAPLTITVNLAVVPVYDSTPETPPVPDEQLPPTGYTATTQANLRIRTNPVITNNTITTIPRGTSVPILARNSDTSWLKVNYDGLIGWVSYAYVTIDPPLIVTNVPIE